MARLGDGPLDRAASRSCRRPASPSLGGGRGRKSGESSGVPTGRQGRCWSQGDAMSWVARRRNLLRKELACLEAEIALCQRCYGDTPRWAARFDRPESLPRILILGERPSRVMLENEERLSVESRDPATRFLRELLQEAGIAQ